MSLMCFSSHLSEKSRAGCITSFQSVFGKSLKMSRSSSFFLLHYKSAIFFTISVDFHKNRHKIHNTATQSSYFLFSFSLSHKYNMNLQTQHQVQITNIECHHRYLCTQKGGNKVSMYVQCVTSTADCNSSLNFKQ